MQGSRLSRFALCAFAAVASLAYAVVGTCRAAYNLARDFVALRMLPAVDAPAVADRDGMGKCSVALLRARQFVARFVKRESPRVESLWRMCPSA